MNSGETSSGSRPALQSLRATLGAFDKIRGLPETSALTKVLAEWGNPDAEPRPASALMETVRRNVIAAAADGYITLSRRDLRLAPWLLWENEKGLAELPGLLEAVCSAATHSHGARRALIEAWIAGCGAARPSIESCGRRLQALLTKPGDLRLDSWRRAQTRFEFFDVRRGPEKVATEILEHQDPVPAILAAAGLDRKVRAQGGYTRLVQSALVAKLPQPLAGANGRRVFARTREFALLEGKLRFQEDVGAFATALLAPWRQSSARQASDAAKDDVRNFLLERLGDPRTKSTNWRNVAEDSIAVMRAWMTRVSLELFFDVIADHADAKFKYRRAFWDAYLQYGHIANAWLALGANVGADARRIEELRGGFGRISGASANQSVLLIQIGSTLFCEWSHAGRLRAWPVGDKTAPALAASEYARSQVTRSGLRFPINPRFGRGGSPAEGDGLRHDSSEQGYWQGSAAELIAQRCGVRLSAKDWMPK